MKALTIFLVTALIVLAGCGGIKTHSSGQENEAFIEILGPEKTYPEGVDVTVDENITFKAVVNKEKVAYTKGEVYAITPGTHTVKVSHNGVVLYEKQIFVSVQETKQIVLP